MTTLRQEAHDRDCMVRLPSVCNFDSTTTVLAHLNLSGISGRGLKAPDLLGAWACFECHRCVDSNGQTHGLDRDFVKLCFYEGIFKTQYALIKEGKVHAGDCEFPLQQNQGEM